ncbi:unnamed protein product, partial [Porites lobata]
MDLRNCQSVRTLIVYRPPNNTSLFCNLSLKKPQFRKKVISTRKLRSLDTDSFYEDVRNSSLVQEQPTDLDSEVDQYDHGLRMLLDQYALARKRLVTITLVAPWHSLIVATEKQKRCRLQRKWRKTRLQSDRESHQYQCCVVNDLISSLKSTYYTSIITEHPSDQRVLFRTVNKLMQKSYETRYP